MNTILSVLCVLTHLFNPWGKSMSLDVLNISYVQMRKHDIQRGNLPKFTQLIFPNKI